MHIAGRQLEITRDGGHASSCWETPISSCETLESATLPIYKAPSFQGVDRCSPVAQFMMVWQRYSLY